TEFASNEVASRDRNAQVIIPYVRPDVVLTASSFKALLTLAHKSSLRDIPVQVVEKEGLKVVFVDKPLNPKRTSNLDRKHAWFKYAARELLCDFKKQTEPKKQKQPLKTESEKQWEKRDKNRRKREARQARRSDATSSGGRLVSEDESELHAALEFEEYEIPQRPDASQLQNPFEKDPSKPDVPSPKPEIKEPQMVAAKSSTNAPSLLDDIFKSQSTLFPEPTWKSAVRVDAGFAGRVSN
ncbi:unnamed protein product, partial [Notodromas monacha]